MTTTPCGNRYRDAANTYDCDLPAGHLGVHATTRGPGESVNWPACSCPKGTWARFDSPRDCEQHGVKTTTPADRQARRKHLADLVLRMRRGELHSQGRDILAAVIKDELADGDQAREQLAARSGTRTASDVLVEHDVTRKAMCDALDVGYHLNWQQLVDTAQRHHDANAEWQAEAEQHRKALAEALDVHPSRDWANLINTAEDVRRGRRAAGLRAHEAEQEAARARRGEAEAVRAREAAEAERDAARRFAEASGTRAYRANERAERAEATLTAVRKIASRLAAHAAGFQDVLDATDAGPWGKTIGADLADLQAALGDPQPATEPEPPTGPAFERRPCGQQNCLGAHPYMRWARIYDCPGPAPEQPAEPQPATQPEAAAELRRLAAMQEVQGRCPACGGNSLFLGDGGFLTCSRLDCPEPDAASALLERDLRAEREAEPDPCAHGCRQAADEHTRLSQEIDAEPEREQPAVTWVPRPCGEALWGSHGGHRYMLGGKGYQCPGGDVRVGTAEPDWTVHLRRPCGEISPHPAHRYTRSPYLLSSDTYGCPGVASPDLRTQPAEPLLRGTVPAIHVHLDNRGAVYHPWPQEWRANPTASGKSEYRRNVEREAEQRVAVYGISATEWDRLWLTVQAIADAAGVKPE